MPASITRCSWCERDDLYRRYHDDEWGMPLHDDRKLFELLNLEGAQAGLSWYTVLSKRENYRNAFDGWDPVKISRYRQPRIARLLEDPGIIRNRLKVAAVVSNAKAFLAVQKEWGSFDAYIWQFVDHQPIVNHWDSTGQLPAHTELSDAMSKDLKKRGFRFVGSTICYSFMQASGMVDDHMDSCWKKTADKKSNQ